ncbi:MAG: rane-bound lytic murein transglycosylase [Campylobacterota bacterium]|nr:rane-bound lytic murein transglycosylase [Campylobacterota bacterium]
MTNKNIKKTTIILFSLYFFIFGWLSHSQYESVLRFIFPTTLEQIKRDGVLNAVLLNSPSTYYIGADGPKGFEYDLLSAYAKYLNVKLNITVANTTKEALELSKDSNIHITSASLAKTKDKETIYNFGPSYLEVQEHVVCYRGMLLNGKFPKDVDNLANLKITVGEDTSYSETIELLKADGFEINATYTSEYSTEELLSKVASNEIDCTIVDSNIFSLNQRYFPDIASAFTIGNREQLAWVLAQNSNKLKEDIYSWLNSFTQSGEMARLKDHYYGNILLFDYQDTTMFYERVKTRLPKYKDLFEKASQKYEIPFSVLAALSYQESHWNPKAQSSTGVRGLMMLTLNTASSLNVEDREDPKESIFGGARHLRETIDLLVKEVEGEDRIKFALAAYNIGMGHITDAQSLAEKMNLNPNAWQDLKKALVLLSQKKHYNTLKHGYARGTEAIKYVESIYNYRDMLQNISITDTNGAS